MSEFTSLRGYPTAHGVDCDVRRMRGEIRHRADDTPDMKRQRGFNIIELMITVAVLGVLLGVGVPGIQSYIYNSRLTTQINSFSTSLAHARSEAIKQNSRVIVCLSSNGSSCDSGNPWNKGWIIFVDRNNNGEIDHGSPGHDDCAQGATTDCVLTVFPAFPGTNTLTPAADVTDMIIYVGDGSARCNTNSDKSNLESCAKDRSFFTLCDSRGAAEAKGVAVSTTGRVSSISKQPNGSPFSCPPPPP